MHKISLVITLKNETEQMSNLVALVSLSKNTETLFVDAHSTDGTYEQLKKLAQNHKHVQVFQKAGNRSVGRNFGVKKTKGNIIAVTDAGCLPHQDWLEKITKPLVDGKADAVAGFYQPKATTLLQKAISPFVSVMHDQFDSKTFLPSSRSIAFTKKAWKKVGGYPENLDYCEDLVFAQKLKDQTKMVTVKSALVEWDQVDSLYQFFKQTKNYAIGDVQAKYTRHIYKHISIFARYIIFIIFPIVLPLYWYWAIQKHYKYIKHPLAIILTPLLQHTVDLAVMKGSIQGLLQAALR